MRLRPHLVRFRAAMLPTVVWGPQSQQKLHHLRPQCLHHAGHAPQLAHPVSADQQYLMLPAQLAVELAVAAWAPARKLQGKLKVCYGSGCRDPCDSCR